LRFQATLVAIGNGNNHNNGHGDRPSYKLRSFCTFYGTILTTPRASRAFAVIRGGGRRKERQLRKQGVATSC
jgi:hypothetical protein